MRPNKKKRLVFRVAQPYLNLLVNFTRFLEKNISLCILKGEMPFKMHKTIFFSLQIQKFSWGGGGGGGGGGVWGVVQLHCPFPLDWSMRPNKKD